MILMLTALVALAEEPPATCDLRRLPEPDAYLSVAWIAPRSRRVGGSTWLTVVPTVDLLTRVQEEEATVGRMLQVVGQRRAGRAEPRRAYKVVVFDVDRASICRPVAHVDAGTVVAGAPVCAAKRRHLAESDGCGFAVGRTTGGPSLPVYRAQWSELVRGGFCVLPADRFIRR